MANIGIELGIIENCTYGTDMRKALLTSITDVNDDLNYAKNDIVQLSNSLQRVTNDVDNQLTMDIQRIQESKGVANGIASLDVNGKLYTNQLPDVLTTIETDVKSWISDLRNELLVEIGKISSRVDSIEQSLLIETPLLDSDGNNILDSNNQTVYGREPVTEMLDEMVKHITLDNNI